MTNFLLAQGDAVDWLASLEDESVDLAITDPAYESLEKHRAKGTTTRLKHSAASSNDWFSIFPNSRFPALFTEVYRVLKRDAHFYLYCDQETMFVAKPMGEAAGFKFWKPIVWDKVSIGMGYHYRCRYEFVLFFEKGKRKLNDLGVADVLTAKRIAGGYPTEKPPEIAEILISQSSAEGQLVIDPFMGSGSTGVAAARRGRNFGGNDLSPASLELARKRLTECGAVELHVIPAGASQLGLFGAGRQSGQPDAVESEDADHASGDVAVDSSVGDAAPEESEKAFAT
jgi:site-specific DNA-methyltransferase (adenine-specific)